VSRISNVEHWEMMKLIVLNFFSHKPVMENFLHLFNVKGAVGAPKEWPQMTRAVIG